MGNRGLTARKEEGLLASIGWAAAMLGAVAGLLLMAVAGFLGTTLLWVANRMGWVTGEMGTWIVLSVSLLASQFASGYVAGRLGRPAASGLNGSLAALGLYAVIASLSLLSGSPAGPLPLALFALVAATLGFWGGTLGGRQP